MMRKKGTRDLEQRKKKPPLLHAGANVKPPPPLATLLDPLPVPSTALAGGSLKVIEGRLSAERTLSASEEVVLPPLSPPPR